MKTKILIILLLCYGLNYSQTKEETKNWIVGKYNDYERVNEFSNICDLTFQNDFIKILDFGTLKTYKIKDIKFIEIRKVRWNNDDKVGWCSMRLRFSNDNSVQMLLSSEFLDDNLQSRMESAIIHLTSLYGGKAIARKESF